MKKDWLTKLIFLLPSFGIVCIALYSLTAYISPLDAVDVKHFLSSFSILFLVGLSCLMIGAGMGFLFGIPKSNKNYENENEQYLNNTNLEQVSDWLTKIIIGIGLTQIGAISAGTLELSKNISSGLSTISPDQLGVYFTASLIVYFIVSGFLIGYLLTRLKLIEELERSHEEEIEHPGVKQGVEQKAELKPKVEEEAVTM